MKANPRDDVSTMDREGENFADGNTIFELDTSTLAQVAGGALDAFLRIDDLPREPPPPPPPAK